jgi:uncharacterized protein DUF2637
MSKLSRAAALLRRISANLAALAVGGVAARATWDHIVQVARKYGESMAIWLPVSIDGMMVAGVILSVDARVTGKPVNPWARGATWLGAVLSILFQIESARERGWIAMIIASIFSVALIVTVEAVAYSSRKMHRAAAVPAEPAPPVQVVEAAEIIAAAPVSPAPVSPDRVIPGTGPVARRPATSPMTGRVLSDRAPRT